MKKNILLMLLAFTAKTMFAQSVTLVGLINTLNKNPSDQYSYFKNAGFIKKSSKKIGVETLYTSVKSIGTDYEKVSFGTSEIMTDSTRHKTIEYATNRISYILSILEKMPNGMKRTGSNTIGDESTYEYEDSFTYILVICKYKSKEGLMSVINKKNM